MIDGMNLGNSISNVLGDYQAKSAVNEKKLESTLSKDLSTATDEELMEAAKSFESYLVEKVMKSVKESLVPKDEDEDNEYLDMFGDNLYQEYAKMITDRGDLGIAKQLYESMKNQYRGNIDSGEEN